MMKKLMMMLAVLLAAGAVSAAPIWEEQFGSAPTFSFGNVQTNIAQGVWAAGNGRFDHRATAGSDGVTIGWGRLRTQGTKTGEENGGAYVLNKALFAAGGTFTLSFDLQIINSTDSFYAGAFEVDAAAGDYITTFNNADAIPSVTGAGATLLNSTSIVPPASWANYSFTFDTDGTKDIELLFGVVDADNNVNTGVGIDNIQVIPEPATLGLVGVAAGALFLFRRTKKRFNHC